MKVKKVSLTIAHLPFSADIFRVVNRNGSTCKGLCSDSECGYRFRWITC